MGRKNIFKGDTGDEDDRTVPSIIRSFTIQKCLEFLGLDANVIYPTGDIQNAGSTVQLPIIETGSKNS